MLDTPKIVRAYRKFISDWLLLFIACRLGFAVKNRVLWLRWQVPMTNLVWIEGCLIYYYSAGIKIAAPTGTAKIKDVRFEQVMPKSPLPRLILCKSSTC